jgi:hypothetical protein
MKKVLRGLILLSWVVFAMGVLAQEAAKDAPEAKKISITAEDVLEKYIQATGGREAREKITSTLTKASLEVTGQSIRGTMEIYAKAPNKVLVVQTVEGYGEVRQGYDGQMGWGQDPFQGVRELVGVELARLKREAAFYGDLKWRELYQKVELVGTEKVGEREAYLIRFTPEVGQPTTRYYDTQTFLLVRTDSVQEGPQGSFPVQEYPSDYRDLDGVKIPFLLTARGPAGEVVMKITEVKNNVEMDDAKFAKPTVSQQ